MNSANNPKYVQYPGSLPHETKELILDCAKLSWLAYSDLSVVTKQYANRESINQNQQGAFEVLKRATEAPTFVTCEGCDAQCYLVKHTPPRVDNLADAPVLAIAARGTTSVMDWMCNARAYQTKFKDCAGKVLKDVQVHAGFYAQFMAIWGVVDRGEKAPGKRRTSALQRPFPWLQPGYNCSSELRLSVSKASVVCWCWNA